MINLQSADTITALKLYFKQETELDPTKQNAIAVMQGEGCSLLVSNEEKFISRFDARRQNHWYILCSGIERAKTQG